MSTQARYQIIRETDPFDGHQTGWGVRDDITHAMVITAESFTIASNLCDSLNGFYQPLGEIEEVADAIARDAHPETFSRLAWRNAVNRRIFEESQRSASFHA